MTFVAAWGKTSVSTLEAYNYNHPVIFTATVTDPTDGRVFSGIVLDVPDDYAAQCQTDRYWSGTYPAAFGDDLQSAVGKVLDGLGFTF